MKKSLVLSALLTSSLLVTSPSFAEDKKPAADAKAAAKTETANPMSAYMDVIKKMQKANKNWIPNTVQGMVGSDAKKKMVTTMMKMSPFGLQQMINMMATKRKVEEGITFDEVIESMKTRANAKNMQLVGHNVPYKLLRQIHDPKSPRLEILSFCDMVTMREIVDFIPEFIIFLPCRIGVLEDAKGDIWLITMDWDVSWLGLDDTGNVNFLSKQLAKRAVMIKEAIDSIMDAGATGDL